jgi:DNA-binding GntR family transcriptional regulator
MGGRVRRSAKAAADEAPAAATPRRGRMSLVDLAYERIEELIIHCELKPGQFLAIQDLLRITGIGRMPVHQAVSRLAEDTLILVRPRHGVQIAPIDLARERMLLQLRRDLERFVIRLAAERSGPSQRNQFLHMERTLRERRDAMTVSEFNMLDRRIDKLILGAAGEQFLEHSLRPLHTIFRRIGWIYHSQNKGNGGLQTTIDCHLAIINAIANHHVDEAVAASDKLITFVDSMFDAMEREIDPSLLDCSLEPIEPVSSSAER